MRGGRARGRARRRRGEGRGGGGGGEGEEEEEEEEEEEAEADVKYLCSYFGYFILGGSRRIPPSPPLYETLGRLKS